MLQCYTLSVVAALRRLIDIENNSVKTNGGRVLAVTSLGESMRDALEIAYSNVDLIDYDDKYVRRDIGFDLAQFE